MIYDCIIAGAGPAGTFCGYLLAKKGYSCRILERLPEYGEKVCGGWLPNIALQELMAAGIDVESFSKSHGARTKSCLTLKGDSEHLYTYPEGIFGLGTARKDFDNFLAGEAMRVGAEISFDSPVKQVEFRDGLYYVNECVGKTFIAAAGARGLIHDKLEAYKEQTFGISAQIRGESMLNPGQVYFWYENEETNDYFWAIPIGENLWNVGLWFRRPSPDMRKRFERGFEKYVVENFDTFNYVIPPKGAFLGNADLTEGLGLPCFSAGDFAGTNNADTGEGLSFALRSAKAAAAKVKESLTVRLTFNVSNCCNMACKYCYAHGGSYHSKENLMKIDTAKKALDLFYSKYKKISSIKFIGGEPALNLEVTEFICRYQKEKLRRGEIAKLPEFIFVTNGTIVNDRLINLANEYGVKIGFSLDAPEFVNDQVRVMKDGTGSASLVLENIRKLQEATQGREPYSVNAVYTKVEEEAGVSIPEIVHYIKDGLQIPSVHIIPVDVPEESPYRLSGNQAFVDGVEELLAEWRNTGNEYFFHNLKGIIRKIEKKLCSPDYICDAGFGLFSISAEGKVYPCHLFTDLEEFCLGTVEENIFASERFWTLSRELREYNRLASEPCKSCPANRICIGCLGANYFRTGSKYIPDPFICDMFRKVVTLVLEAYGIQDADWIGTGAECAGESGIKKTGKISDEN